MSASGDDGKVGPYSSLLGFEVVEVSAEQVILEATPGPEHLNGGGIIHGGYLTSLLDSATGWAVHAAMGAERGGAAPHTHLSVQFLRAGRAGERMTCTARCLRAGRRVAAAEAEIVQDGRVLARAVTTHAVV